MICFIDKSFDIKNSLRILIKVKKIIKFKFKDQIIKNSNLKNIVFGRKESSPLAPPKEGLISKIRITFIMFFYIMYNWKTISNTYK